MACIEKRVHSSGSVTYRVRIRVMGSPNISESFPTRRAAKEWADKLEAEVRQGRYFDRTENKERTFAELVDRYIQQEVPGNPKSFKKCIIQLLWWNRHLKDYYLCAITPAVIAEIKEFLIKEVTSRKTLRSQSTA